MTLYVVATPIGNLADMTYRAVKVLQDVDYILCENTRHSRKLLAHYDIRTPLRSYHRFNEAAREQAVLEDLRAKREIALISDAGTPGVADPGERLVALCRAAEIAIVALPGPCALIAALASSGLPTDRFQFLGFWPRKSSECKQALIDALAYPGTTVSYEAPHRLLDILKLLAVLAPKRELVIARELTKKFEDFRRGTAEELLDSWGEQAPRGEIVLMLSGAGAKESEQAWASLSPEQHVLAVQEQYQLSRNEAIKLVAKLRGISKRDLYRFCVEGPTR